MKGRHIPPAGKFTSTLGKVALVAAGLALALSLTTGAWAEDFLYCQPQADQAWLSESRVVLSRLSLASNLPTPRLSISQETRSNAYARNAQEIVVTRGLINNLANAHELAFVLAHELGHIRLQFMRERPSLAALRGFSAPSGHVVNMPLEEERQADFFALNLMRALGFDSQQAPNLLYRLTAQLGASQERQSLEQRAALVQAASAE
ncbi:MAG: M48 family metalloprotease [Oligoflexia bacterium]|nr:M48 family metalloprotease [Oligoflexia bacterium]